MVRLIAKITVQTGADKGGKPVTVPPGSPFEVETEEEAADLVDGGYAERAKAGRTPKADPDPPPA